MDNKTTHLWFSQDQMEGDVNTLGYLVGLTNLGELVQFTMQHSIDAEFEPSAPRMERDMKLVASADNVKVLLYSNGDISGHGEEYCRKQGETPSVEAIIRRTPCFSERKIVDRNRDFASYSNRMDLKGQNR